MLLVKKLIAYDTADELPVSHFQLSPLPETAPNTSCLDILNFFQEGRSWYPSEVLGIIVSST